MKKFVIAFLMLMFAPFAAAAQDCPTKVLAKHTATATLVSYYVEEVQDIPSTCTFKLKGKDIDLVDDQGMMEKLFAKKEGKKFKITYEVVNGWLGDGCDTYNRLVEAREVK